MQVNRSQNSLSVPIHTEEISQGAGVRTIGMPLSVSYRREGSVRITVDWRKIELECHQGFPSSRVDV